MHEVYQAKPREKPPFTYSYASDKSDTTALNPFRTFSDLQSNEYFHGKTLSGVLVGIARKLTNPN